MPLRVLGPRVLLKPISQTSGSALITLTDHEPPTIAEVIGLGRARCADCGARRDDPLQIGDVVMIPATVGQEITVDGVPYWVVPIDAVLSYWTPEEPHA